MTDLSILIPARNEMFLSNTVEDILKHIEGDTEIIVVLDGEWPTTGLPIHPRLTVVHHPVSIGQRAATNEAARLSTAEYLMKVDAHCSFDQGFDVKLMERCDPDWTVVPILRNLHAFNWICENGHERYQGPSGPCVCWVCSDGHKNYMFKAGPCEHRENHEYCNKPTTLNTDCTAPTKMLMKWKPRRGTRSKAYCFDSTPHFQYFNDYVDRPGVLVDDMSETMSLQGSCFMMTRQKYFELNVCDESFGSWGSQGIEVASKTWLSGGRVMTNHRTWYAHLFRTQGGDFGFPYSMSSEQQDLAKETARRLFFRGEWKGAVRPLSWLVEKFWPVPGWAQEDLDKLKEQREVQVGIVYYTDSRLDETIATAVRKQIKTIIPDQKIISVSLAPIDGFGWNILQIMKPGYLTMFKQILLGIEASTADVIFFCEHDVLYHPSHFDFRPSKKDVFYYNTNVWKVDAVTGRALHYDCKQTSGLCAYRSLLLNHYQKRVELVEKNGYSRKMGFEPGTHGRTERVDDYKSDVWVSEYPNIDIRHDRNLTASRWSKEQFRDQRYTKGWTEADNVPGWGKTKGCFEDLLKI